MGTRIAAALAFVLICLFGWREYSAQRTQKKLNGELERCQNLVLQLTAVAQRTDTIYIDKFVYTEVPRPYPVTHTDTVYDTIQGTQEVFTYYADSVPTKDVTLFYALQTSGVLRNLDLSYRLHQPVIEKHHIVYQDKVIEKEQKLHLWGGLAFGKQHTQATFAATYQRVGIMYTHDITYQQPLVGLTFKFR